MLTFSPGLAGVPAAKSSISFVNGQTGLLEYRGIRIEELAQRSSFLETTYLLLYDELPAQTELDRFTVDVTQHRRIKYQITELIKCLPEHGHPMDALQAAVAALGMFYPARNVLDRQVQYWSTIRLIAKVPTIVAAYYRLRRGDEQIQPRDDLNHTSNFLYMLTEKVYQLMTFSRAVKQREGSGVHGHSARCTVHDGTVGEWVSLRGESTGQWHSRLCVSTL